MKIILNENPISKQRARHKRVGKAIWTYDPQEKDKKRIKQLLISILKNASDNATKENLIELNNIINSLNLRVNLKFFLATNKSDSVPTRNKKLWGLIPANIKPDVDNLAKFNLDCSNNILYSDDRLITSLDSDKYFSENPRTEIEIMSKKEYTENNLVPFEIFSPVELGEFNDELGEIRELLKDNCRENMGDEDEIWIKSAAKVLTNFSVKYADKLKKIAMSQKKSIKQGKTLC